MKENKISELKKFNLSQIPVGVIPKNVFEELVKKKEQLDLEIVNSMQEQQVLLENRDILFRKNQQEINQLSSIRSVSQFISSLEIHAKKAGFYTPNTLKRNLEKVTSLYVKIQTGLKLCKHLSEVESKENKEEFLKLLQEYDNDLDIRFKKFREPQIEMIAREDICENYLSQHFMSLKKLCEERQKIIFREIIDHYNKFFDSITQLVTQLVKLKLYYFKQLKLYLFDSEGKEQNYQSNFLNREAIKSCYHQIESGFDPDLEKTVTASMEHLKSISKDLGDEISDPELISMKNELTELDSLTSRLISIHAYIYTTSQTIIKTWQPLMQELNSKEEAKSGKNPSFLPPLVRPTPRKVLPGIWRSSNSAFRPITLAVERSSLKRKNFP